MRGIKRLTVAAGIVALDFCLLFSGCVIYPEDNGFPQKVRVALLSNNVPFFESPSEIVGLNLDPNYSDYSSSATSFLLSYTGANRGKFDYYISYLVGILGYYDADVSDETYSCYAWAEGNTVIESGFSDQRVSVPVEDVSISAIPSYTLYLLIQKF
jgi:hypothetical protein